MSDSDDTGKSRFRREEEMALERLSKPQLSPTLEHRAEKVFPTLVPNPPYIVQINPLGCRWKSRPWKQIKEPIYQRQRTGTRGLNLAQRYASFGLCNSKNQRQLLKISGFHKIPDLWLCLSAPQHHPHAGYPQYPLSPTMYVKAQLPSYFPTARTSQALQVFDLWVYTKQWEKRM